MPKDIRTHEADYKLTQKFLDYANIADASYALLEYTNDEYIIRKNSDGTKDISDGQKLGSTYFNKDTNTEQISTYARAIEARFMQDSKNSQGKKIDNKIQNVSKEIDSTQYKDSNGCHIFNTEINKCQKLYPKELSDRTITFVNRFQLLFHQPNTESGFSATLFRDTQADSKDSEYILAFRGTEDSKDIFEADVSLIGGAIPKKQYLDMLDFYGECIEKSYITESTPLIIVGHSLGGCLTQLFALSFATPTHSNIVKEIYTFNSPGAKKLDFNAVLIDMNDNYADNLQKVLTLKRIKYHKNKIDELLKEIYQKCKNGYDMPNANFHHLLISAKVERDTSSYSQIKITLYAMHLNEFYANKIENFFTNKELQQPLACQDSIHHIEADDDSNPDNNKKIDNLIQDLGKDIDGKHYLLNILGEHFTGIQYFRVDKWFDSHYLSPLIMTLKEAIMLMNNKVNNGINNLLEYNQYKERISKYEYQSYSTHITQENIIVKAKLSNDIDISQEELETMIMEMDYPTDFLYAISYVTDKESYA